MLAAIGSIEHWLRRVWVSSALSHCWLGNTICSWIYHKTCCTFCCFCGGHCWSFHFPFSITLCISETTPVLFDVCHQKSHESFEICSLLWCSSSLPWRSMEGGQMCRNSPDDKLHLADSNSFSAEYKNWFGKDIYNVCVLTLPQWNKKLQPPHFLTLLWGIMLTSHNKYDSAAQGSA